MQIGKQLIKNWSKASDERRGGCEKKQGYKVENVELNEFFIYSPRL